MSKSHLQHRGTHYRFRFLPELDRDARCVLCRRALVDGCYDDAFCERCGVPMHFSCHQRVAASLAEREALQAMVDELNAPGPMVEVEIGSPEGGTTSRSASVATRAPPMRRGSSCCAPGVGREGPAAEGDRSPPARPDAQRAEPARDRIPPPR